MSLAFLWRLAQNESAGIESEQSLLVFKRALVVDAIEALNYFKHRHFMLEGLKSQENNHSNLHNFMVLMLKGLCYDAAMRKPKPTQKEYGRIGGLVGGKIRAERLSPERRKAIARKAAEARWKTKEVSEDRRGNLSDEKD